MLKARAADLLGRVADAAYIARHGRAGLGVGDVAQVRRWEAWRELASRYGVDVRTVLYIGANEGQEAELLLRAFPEAVLHCFEPQDECQPALERLARHWPGRVEVHAVALSDAAGDVQLARPLSHGQATSMLRPNAAMGEHFPHVGGWQTQIARAVRLDDWAAGRDLPGDVLVKLDVQGAELLVLRGGEVVLARSRLLVLEVAVVPTYDGAPDVPTVFRELLRRGWAYAGEMGQVRDEAHVVVEFDGAFVRRTAS